MKSQGRILMNIGWLPACLVVTTAGCSVAERRFALRDPVTVDTDLRSVSLPCRSEPGDKDKNHLSCAPREYVSPLLWDGTDNLAFRPLAEAWAFRAPREAANANSMDEVADSAWFTNRIGARAFPIEELTKGACEPSQMLDTENLADGSWLVDHGKTDGSTPGFRISVGGKKYLLKVDTDAPERPSAASTIGAAVYNAVGFFTSCEQVVYVKPSAFKLKPGLKYKGNFDGERDFDRAALERILSKAPKKGDLVRLQASAWLPGKLLGPFRYVSTRPDDPNDIIDHEERRELRGGRVLASWLDHFDAREQNSMDTWVADPGKPVDGSPGHVVHYYLDTSDCLGSAWDWEVITRRLGYSYVVDWGDLGRDFITLGLPLRPWDRVQRQPGHEIFNYFDVKNFVPDHWKNEYANPAFDRMTERDGAWMARILARFTPEMMDALAGMARFSDPATSRYLASVLEGRLEKILDRYLTRLSPLSEVHIDSSGELCATDLAVFRHVRDPRAFFFRARDEGGHSLPVEHRDEATVCVSLPHSASGPGVPDDDPSRYVRVSMSDGIAEGPLVANVYDLGPVRGFRLVGLERPEH
jgi:hypothetical protein